VTEAEWARKDLREQLHLLEGKASDRKARLFTCGIGRCMLPFLRDERSRRVVEVAEKHVEGLATDTELLAASIASRDANRGVLSHIAEHVGIRNPWSAARMTVALLLPRDQVPVRAWGPGTAWDYGRRVAAQVAANARGLLHCVFGNRFHSPAIDPGWLTWNGGTVVKLAQAIYDERAFDRLPVLADALEEAGCDNPDILSHLRGPGPHARGCWPVDLLLNRR
jgi:hypothetical protein